jgi:hypothetical protein
MGGGLGDPVDGRPETTELTVDRIRLQPGEKN